MNYARTNAECSILAVNTFVQDASHHNPLIRALALRSMSSIRVVDTNTDIIPNGVVTASSSGTDLCGGAVRQACVELQQRLSPYREDESETLATVHHLSTL